MPMSTRDDGGVVEAELLPARLTMTQGLAGC